MQSQQQAGGKKTLEEVHEMMHLRHCSIRTKQGGPSLFPMGAP